MQKLKLYKIMLGAKPAGRHTEQHDIFFTIGDSLKSCIPGMKSFWPEAHNLHVDAWREVTSVDGFSISIAPRDEAPDQTENKLFFINLGGYKAGEFDEPHYKMILVAPDMAAAVKRAKATAFYQHTGFKGATSHIDDRYGVDVDDVYEVNDILPDSLRRQFRLVITAAQDLQPDEVHLGYFQLHKIQS